MLMQESSIQLSFKVYAYVCTVSTPYIVPISVHDVCSSSVVQNLSERQKGNKTKKKSILEKEEEEEEEKDATRIIAHSFTQRRMLRILRISVSYTHLTLPTTPYV